MNRSKFENVHGISVFLKIVGLDILCNYLLLHNIMCACIYTQTTLIWMPLIRACQSSGQQKLLYDHESGDRKMAESSRVAQKSIPQKHKRSVMTLETRMKIVGEVKKGSSQRVVDEKFGIAKFTVGDI